MTGNSENSDNLGAGPETDNATGNAANTGGAGKSAHSGSTAHAYDSDLRLQARREAFSSWDGFLALGFGAGLSPFAPGTVGTLVAVPFAFLLAPLGGFWGWLVLLLLFVAGCRACDQVGKRLGVTDYGGFVFDEMLGYWVAISLLPMQWPWLLAAFLLFRILDIWKPWPIRAVEARVPGGLGVMLDDLLAGGLTLAVLLLLERWLA